MRRSNASSLVGVARSLRATAYGIGLSFAFATTCSGAPAFVPVNSMIEARYGHAAALLPSGKVLVAGGRNFDYLWTAEIFDPASASWTYTQGLLTPCVWPTATVLTNGMVLVAGGMNTGGSPVATAQLYDSASGQWAPTAPLNKARYRHTASLLRNGQVLVAGGFDNNTYLTSAELYDPATGTWTTTNSMATPRGFHAATVLADGRVLIAGGIIDASGNPTTSVESFNPATGTWTAATALAIGRDDHTASLLPDGRVLVAGGWNGTYRSSVEVYAPGSGLWSVGNTMSTARGSHTATVLTNGNVLVIGGQGINGTVGTGQLFNFVGGTWGANTPLVNARQSHTATLLPNGKVLVAGGQGDAFAVLNSAELWDPAGDVVDTNALALALDGPALVWASGGARAWSPFASATHDGVDAAQSGFVSDDQESWLRTSVQGPGTLTFWWKVSSETNFDWLRFHLDGVLQQQISGEVNWQERTIPIPSGSHSLLWRYVKDSGIPGGQDRAWLDEVAFTPAAGAPVIVIQPRSESVWLGANVTLNAVALGGRPLTLQWYFNSTNSIPNATNASLLLNAFSLAQAGQYHLVASNAQGSAVSSPCSVTLTNNTAASQVLLFSDNLGFSPIRQALTNLSQTFQVYSTETAFNSAVAAANRAAALAIVDAPQGTYAFSSLSNFVSGGGRVLIQAYSLAGDPTLAALFQAAIENRSVVPLPLYNWGGSPLFSSLPSPINFQEILLSEDAQRLHPLPGAMAVAGFTNPAASGQGSILVGNSGRTILNGFYVQGATQTANAVRLAENEIGFLTGALGAPAIHTQPRDQYPANGGTASFGVVAVGARPLTFQWRKGGQPISGATGTNYTIAGVQSNYGFYDVVVSNSFGSVTSRLAVLDLGIQPLIRQQPQPITVVAGENATFTVIVTNTATLPITYQWRKGSTPLTNIVLHSTQCSFTLYNVRTNVTTTNGPGSYRVIITNPATTGSGVPSDSVSLNVLTASPPVAITGTASATTANSATLHGTINPLGATTTGWFEYGLITTNGSTTEAIQIGNGSNEVSFQASVTNLQPATTYHFRIVAGNFGGVTVGLDQSFTTGGAGPSLAIQPDGAGGYFIRFGGLPGLTYRLLRAHEVSGPWDTIDTRTAPASGVVEHHDATPLPGQAFYRVVQP